MFPWILGFELAIGVSLSFVSVDDLNQCNPFLIIWYGFIARDSRKSYM